ncbi:hypothetical protein Tco_0519635 [Tanacetum coccineum]
MSRTRTIEELKKPFTVDTLPLLDVKKIKREGGVAGKAGGGIGMDVKVKALCFCNKLAWVKWDNVLASFDKGGLGVGSLKAFNLALLQKWCWRLINNTNLLWVRLIKSIHGVEAGLNEKGRKMAGLWSRIVGTVNYLHSSGVIPRGTLIYRVGCGTKVWFWKDVWLGDVSLKEKYNRLFHLDRNGDCVIRDRIYNGAWSWDWCRHDLGSRNNEALVSLLSDIGNIVVDSGTDTCSWNIATGGIFSVGVTRNHIDNHMLPSAVSHTRWNNVLPRKVNIFVWRFLLVRLPHRLKLWNECYDNEDELQSFRHKTRQQDKVYDEREENCWILHLCIGIFYLKGHEGVMNEVPDGAAIFASSYWLRNSDMYRV